jgi:O-antigen/teichoic acid export membrane protein
MARSTAQASAVFVGRAVAAFAATIIFTRGLGPVGRGQVVFATNVAGMIALVAGSGTVAALVRMRVEWPDISSELYPVTLIVSAIYGVGAAALYGLVAVVVGPSASPGLAGGGVVLVAAMIVPILTVNNLTQAMGLTGRLGRATIASLLGSAGYLVLVAGLGIAGRLSPVAVVASFAIGTALLPLLVLMRRDGEPRVTPGAVWAATRRLLRTSMGANVGAMAALILWRADLFLVQYLLGDADLGYYSAATAIAEVLLVLVITLRTALLPAQGSGRVESAEIGGLIARVLRLGLLLGAVASLVLLVGGRFLLVGLYGAAYGRVWTSLVVLAPGVILFGLQFPLFDYLSARGGNRRLAVLGLLALGVEIGVDIFAIPALGFIGAALVSTATYGVLFIGSTALFAKAIGQTWVQVLVVRGSDLAARQGGVAAIRRRERSI